MAELFGDEKAICEREFPLLEWRFERRESFGYLLYGTAGDNLVEAQQQDNGNTKPAVRVSCHFRWANEWGDTQSIRVHGRGRSLEEAIGSLRAQLNKGDNLVDVYLMPHPNEKCPALHVFRKAFPKFRWLKVEPPHEQYDLCYRAVRDDRQKVTIEVARWPKGQGVNALWNAGVKWDGAPFKPGDFSRSSNMPSAICEDIRKSIMWHVNQVNDIL